jgi:hypothetical protein
VKEQAIEPKTPMSDERRKFSKRLLEAHERVCEVLFGLMRLLVFIAPGVGLGGGQALAQATTNAAVAMSTNDAPALTKEAAEKGWSFYASAYTYVVPDSREYVQPTFTADRGWLHLEGRYNYEGLDTGSVWIGYNLSVGDKVSFEITPMLGGVFGDTTGIAPGYKGSLSWWKLELSSEGEYLFDTRHSSDSFFYTWSELSLSPVDWFRVGGVVQRTKLYRTDLDIQRGFLVGFSFKRVDLTTYVFNPGDEPTFVFAVGVSF